MHETAADPRPSAYPVPRRRVAPRPARMHVGWRLYFGGLVLLWVGAGALALGAATRPEDEPALARMGQVVVVAFGVPLLAAATLVSVLGYLLGREQPWARPVLAGGIVAVVLAAVLWGVADAHGLSG